jgi:hypothetical protein
MSYYENLPVIEVGEGASDRGHGFLWALLTLLLVSLAVSAWVLRFSAVEHVAIVEEVAVPPSAAEKERMLESLSEGSSQEGEAERLLALEALADSGEEAAELSLEEMQGALLETLGSEEE